MGQFYIFKYLHNLLKRIDTARLHNHTALIATINVNPVLEMGRYTTLGLLFVPEFHTRHLSVYATSIYLFYFLMVYLCFAFMEYTGTFRFPFRVLCKPQWTG